MGLEMEQMVLDMGSILGTDMCLLLAGGVAQFSLDTMFLNAV